MQFAIKNITIINLFNGKANTNTDNYIHQEDDDNINYWLKKLNISKKDLNDAILYTGSINIIEVKQYLKKVKGHRTFFPRIN